MDSSIRSLLVVVLMSFSLLLVVGPFPGGAQALQSHDPILISSESDFTCANGVTCVSGKLVGNGTILNPFVIEGWEITANTTAGIEIRGTHSFFEIKNVYIHPTGFTASSSGILLTGVTNGRVESARISNFYIGISLFGSQTTITTSEVWNNTYGIHLTGINNLVSFNQAHNNTLYGIFVESSLSNTFTGNNVSDNSNGCTFERIVNPCDGQGVVILSSSNNIFQNNTVAGNPFYGFHTALRSNNNVYRYNNISKNQFGLIFTDGTGNQAYGNVLNQNLYGIGLEGDNTNNNVTLNWITNSGWGVYVYNSTQNTIYNNYLQNSVNAVDNRNQNSWNITKTLAPNILGGPFRGGNFYSDYVQQTGGSDPDGDGFGNTPYVIHGACIQPCPGLEALDLLPLVQAQPPGSVVDIEVRGVSAQPSSGRTGTIVSLTVNVFNEGTVPESFTFTVTYNGTVVHNSLTGVTSLPALSGKTFIISWDTNGLVPGKYLVKANATAVPGEPYTGNNVSPATVVTLSLNQPPTAAFTITPTNSFVGAQVTMDGTASHDPDGTVSNYSWDFGDGKSATGETASHAYSTAGTYTITLTVRDDEGALSQQVSHSLTVSSNMPSAPDGLMITSNDGTLKLSWSPPSSTGGSPIVTYRIYRGTSSDRLSWIANTTSTNYVDTTVSGGQTYYYAVTAVNRAAESNQSIPQNVLVPASGAADLPMTPMTWLAIIVAAAVIIAAGILVVRRRARAAT